MPVQPSAPSASPAPVSDAVQVERDRGPLYTTGPFMAGERTNPEAPKIGTRFTATLGGSPVSGVVIGHGNWISRAWGNVTVLLDGDWSPIAWPIAKLPEPVR